jgi:integrase/recombinase XerD
MDWETQVASLAKKTANMLNPYHPTPAQYKYFLKMVREKMVYTVHEKKKSKVHKILTDEEVKKIRDELIRSGKQKYLVMFYVLYYTGIRVNELVNIQIRPEANKKKDKRPRYDVKLEEKLIYIIEGKGSKERVVLIHDGLYEALALYINSKPTTDVYLFENRFSKKYTTRGIQKLVKGFGEKAGLEAPIHPHMFRHKFITKLRVNGLKDASIQRLTGHSDTKSLDIYSHFTAKDVARQFNEALERI